MTRPEQPADGDRLNVYLAELLVSQELLRTHGIIFAAEFMDQFAPEICVAATKLALRRAWDNSGNPTD
jgi:hypothetical protein